eukprot:Rhum_TRINITY_DN10192_c0_g1::Rhum_TRINITY_DN10192_c0_g1_i1::g.37223::m.37223/K16809/QN1; protein QN1
MPNENTFGVGLDSQGLSRMLAAESGRSAAQQSGDNSQPAAVSAAAAAAAAHTSPPRHSSVRGGSVGGRPVEESSASAVSTSINLSTIAPRRSSSTVGADNDIRVGVSSASSNLTRSASGTAAGAAATAVGGASATEVLESLRQREEATDRRAAEREARREADRLAGIERRRRLDEEHRLRREARRAAAAAAVDGDEDDDDGDGDGDGASPVPRPVLAAGVPAAAAAQPAVAVAQGVDRSGSSFPSLSDNTESQHSPLGFPSAASGAASSAQQQQQQQAGAAGAAAAPVPPPVLAQQQQRQRQAEPKPCQECPNLRMKVDILERQLRTERGAVETEKAELLRPLQEKLMHLERVNASLSDSIEQYRVHNEVLQAKAEGRNVRREIANGNIETVTLSEMIAIRKEITHQEALIHQYQAEDEKNSLELRTLRQQATELQKQLLGWEQSAAARDAARDRSREEQTTPGRVDTSGVEATRVVKDLSRENARLKETLRIREEEFALQLEAAKKNVRAVEAKLQAVDWQKAEDDAVTISNLQLELRKQKAHYEQLVEELQAKVEWYVKNQEILSKHDALVERQGAEIETLKSRVVVLDTQRGVGAGAGAAGKKKGGKVDSAKYIQDLHHKIKGLEEIIASKYPNSLPELIRACKPTETEVGMYAAMQSRIAQLGEELSAREEEYEKGIRQLRQESDKMVLEYKERYTTLNDECKLKVRNATSAKVKELERRIDDTRAYYLKKVKELETQVLDMRRQSKKAGGSAAAKGGGDHPRRTAAAQTDDAPPLLPPQQPQQAQQQPHAMQPFPAHFPYPVAVQPQQPAGVSASEVVLFAGEIAKLRAENDVLRREEGDARRRADDVERTRGACRVELEAALREKGALEEEAARLRDAAARERRERADEVARVGQQWRDDVAQVRARCDEEVRRLAQIVDEGDADERRAAAAAAEPPGAEQRAEYLAAVRRKLRRVERDYALRVAEVQRALDEARRTAAFNLDVQKQRMDLVVQAKNNELERFRIQLDSLLEELCTLRAHHSRRAPSSTTA